VSFRLLGGRSYDLPATETPLARGDRDRGITAWAEGQHRILNRC